MMMRALAGIDLTPHPSFWFVLPLFLASGAAIVYLYAAQRQLASELAVRTLTANRVALVLLLLVLFLQPTLKWMLSRTSNGELWLLIDQSPSMQSTDPQANPAEHVRWAEALGYISRSARPAKPDIALANFLAVASDFNTLRPSSAQIGAPLNRDQELARVADLAGSLAKWRKSLANVHDQLADDPSASSADAKTALSTLENIISFLNNGISGVKSAVNLHEADGAVDWGTIQGDLAHVAGDLAKVSADSDAAFARDHAADASSATARLTGMTRADLAQAFVTNKERRPGSDSSVADLISKYRVRIATFADSAQTTAAIDPATFPDALHSALAGGANTHSTNLVSGLQAISEQIAPGQPAAILVISDGRHNAGGDPTEPARLLASRGARVYGLLVGSHEVSPDAAVEQIDAPDWIFKGDTLHAAAILRLDGLAGQTAHLELEAAAGFGRRHAGREVGVPTSNQQTVNASSSPTHTAAGRPKRRGGHRVHRRRKTSRNARRSEHAEQPRRLPRRR